MISQIIFDFDWCKKGAQTGIIFEQCVLLSKANTFLTAQHLFAIGIGLFVNEMLCEQE